jgi:hypothetical protein
MYFKKTLLCFSLAGTMFLQGCGGSNSYVASTLTVVPALGAVFGATVQVIDQNGNVVMTGTTGSNGVANLQSVVPITGPVVIKVTLPVGATYFDEKSGTNKTVATATNLYSVSTGIGSSTSVGVTPLTNMAAKLAGVSDASSTASGLTATGIATAVAKVNLALGLPVTFNILQAPSSVATSTSNIPTTGYSGLLASIARTAAVDALTQASSLSAAVSTNGTVSDFSALTVVVSAVSTSAQSTINQAPQTPVTNNTALVSTATSDASSVLNAISNGATGATGSTGSTGATGSVN